MSFAPTISHKLHEEEIALLEKLREKRRVAKAGYVPPQMGFGDRVADDVAAMMGSWPFIIIQSCILAAWMTLNVLAWVHHWDPYPFILLNLALSFQGAYAAPFIMMSQNRQAAMDRQEARHDYEVNVKAELEIELLHQKIDMLREKEFQQLADIITKIEARLGQAQQ